MICMRMNHVGDRNFHEIHSCKCCFLNDVDQVIYSIKTDFDGKQFLIPCSYIEDGIVYRIGLEALEGELKNYVWEVNATNYSLFRSNVEKAYGVILPKSCGLSSKQMDENLFNFFEELNMTHIFKENVKRHSFKLNGFTVIV